MAGPTSDGQRRSRVDGGRRVRIVVRVTDGEYAQLARRAGAAALTVPSYLAVTGLRPDGVPIAETRSALTNLTAVRRLLIGATTNLNQLTAKLHATGELDPALPAVLAAVQRIAARTDQAVTDLAATLARPGDRPRRAHRADGAGQAPGAGR